MKTAATFCSLVMLVLVSQSPAIGQIVNDGITVSGTGDYRAKPSMVEIDVRVSAKAELADDALVKHQQALRSTKDAFAALKLANLKVLERGMTLAPGDSAAAMQAMMRGQAVTNEKQQIEISTPVRLQLTGIDQMPLAELFKVIGKMLDVARDTGATLGLTQAETYRNYYSGQRQTAQIVRFVIRDLNEMREQAYERAVTDARRRGERIARLSGVKLGPITSVHETQVSGDEMNYNQYQGQMLLSSSAADEPNIASDTYAEIPFRVKLLVRFAIDKSEVKTAQR